jgi:hypothetical protein
MLCATPLNTRIFAGDLEFGEFHAILRGGVVKIIHILHAPKNNFKRTSQKIFELVGRNYYKLEEIKAQP